MRTARKQSAADIYHVVSRGTGRQLIFENDADYKKFLELLDNAIERTGVSLFAWCLMGNHFHLLIQAPIERVSQCMKLLCGGYSFWFNRKSGRVGHLFQERYKSEPVDTDEYLLTVIRYIHNNPEKAGIATAAKYRWSSYREYAGEPMRCQTEFPISVFGREAITCGFADADAGAQRCLDVGNARETTRALRDSAAIEKATEVVGMPIGQLKELPVKERNEGIVALKKDGFTVRQIERLTGIGRNIVQRA